MMAGSSEYDGFTEFGSQNNTQVPYAVNVDVSKNFNFVTNFGSFKISTLMSEYVFEAVISCLNQFMSLRLPMKGEH